VIGLIELLILALTTFLVGIVASMVGIGGGFLGVPILILLLSVPPHQAVGTSLTMCVFTALSSTIAYARQGRIDYRVGLVLALGTVPGAISGAYITRYVSAGDLTALFGIFLIGVALRMMMAPGGRTQRDGGAFSVSGGWRRRIVDSGGQVFEYTVNVPLAALMGFLGGLSSGFFGVGGGAVLVPIMRLLLGIPMHITVAISMFTMIFTTSSGVTTHMLMGNVILHYAVCMAAGVIAGAQLGASIARRLKARRLEVIFGIFLVIIGLRMVLKAFLA